MKRTIYVAGPMRGIRHFNFPAFDKARDELVARGWNVISPADLDREVGFDEKALPEDYDWNDLSKIGFDLKSAVRRDVEALLRSDAIFMLDGYTKSKGATAELHVARWLGLEEYFEGNELPDARYRFLAIGEVIEKGDEYEHRKGEWLPVKNSIGKKVQTSRWGFRRRLPEPVGDGYRQLEVGEVLEKDDEVFGVDGKWVRTVAAGCVVDRGGKYRRKVESPSAKFVPEVGDGYRKLEVGEKIEEGDEFYSALNGAWMRAVDHVQMTGYTYRRKIKVAPEVEEGYRFLEVGEKIEKGDEVWNAVGKWQNTIAVGCSVAQFSEGFYRRKIQQPAKIEQPNEDVLEEALRITRGDRQAQYGPPDQDFRRSAGMLTALFADTLLKEGAKFEPFHIAQMMILLKMSRQLHQRKRDNWVDTAGYARCGAICDEVAK